MNICCIEDDEADMAYLKILIQQAFPGASLTFYRYLRDFLNSPKGYDVILADLGLPDRYGPMVLQDIRKRTGKPIIVISGVGGQNPSPEIMAAMKKAGANAFLSKQHLSAQSLSSLIKSFI